MCGQKVEHFPFKLSLYMKLLYTLRLVIPNCQENKLYFKSKAAQAKTDFIHSNYILVLKN